MQISKTIKIFRKRRGIVSQNIALAIGVKPIGPVMAACKYVAVFADAGVRILAVLNAVPARSVKKL